MVMYFPIISKQALEEALTFALGLKHPGLKVTLVEASKQEETTTEGADRAG